MSLAEVLVAYEQAHGQHVASAGQVVTSSRIVVDYFGDAAAVDACDVDRIEAFKKWMLGKGYNAGYVNRVLGVLRAALMRAYERRLIPLRPVVKTIAGHRGEPKGRPLSVVELKKLYAEASEPHLRRFIVLGLGTGARPDAIKALQWEQVDLATRTASLNPIGRVQTKKRRAEVPVCDRLAAELEQWGSQDGFSGPVVHFRGQAVESVKTSWRKLRARTALGEECQPYSLRHSVAKYLRSQSVPPWEVAGFLGHKFGGYSITEIYAGASPEHMRATKQALDKLLTAVLDGDAPEARQLISRDVG